MDKKSRNTMIVSVIALALVLIGVTYAYFSARITGLESASTISLTAGRMGIHYSEGDEEVTFTNIYPREEAWATKTFTLTAWNTTDLTMKYDVGLNIETNTFTSNYLTYDLILISSTNGNPIANKTGVAIDGIGKFKIGTGSFNNANADTHNYELKIYFKDNGLDQNDAQNAVFNAKIYVSEYEPSSINVPRLVLSSFDIDEDKCIDLLDSWGYDSSVIDTVCAGELYSDGGWSWQLGDGQSDDRLIEEGVILNPQYTEEETSDFPIGYEVAIGPYTYKYHYVEYKGYDDYWEHEIDGWSVKLTDYESTSPINEAPYVLINGEPVIVMSQLFSNSQVTSIDLSSFDTSKVTEMVGMFEHIKVNQLDFSSFDTSKVTDMGNMFYYIDIPSLDLSSFDTSSVENMGAMFLNTTAATLNLSSFDTSKVTNMRDMFAYSHATSLDLSNFDTSKVTNMASMFWNSTNLQTIYVSNTFVLSSVSNTGWSTFVGAGGMFSNCTSLVGGAGTTYDFNHTDGNYAHIDGGSSNPGYFTAK